RQHQWRNHYGDHRRNLCGLAALTHFDVALHASGGDIGAEGNGRQERAAPIPRGRPLPIRILPEEI
ncbi:hypothetical protein, partial [Accumulibacter sp.]|uniref:hypothetical protein n=1 Tax=Accumulibacter sp. TaxID=2053492 RepID=UPI002C251B44